MTIHPTVRGVAIALLAVTGAFGGVAYFYQERIAGLVASLGAAQSEALGVNWTKVRTARNLAATVPALRDELARAGKAGTKPIAAVHISSGATEFNLPDWSPCGSTAPPGPTPAGGPEAGAAASPQPPLLVSADAQGALTGLADGTIRQTWRMWATLTRGEWTERRELDDVKSDMAIDPALAAAWKAAVAPSYRIDVFVGASLGLDGAGITGGVMGGRGRAGWFAEMDYVLADAARSRVSGGARITLKK